MAAWSSSRTRNIEKHTQAQCTPVTNSCQVGYVTLGKRLIFTDLTLIKKIGSQICSQHLEVKSIDFIYPLLKLLHESFSLGWICYVNDFCPSTNQEGKKTF